MIGLQYLRLHPIPVLSRRFDTNNPIEQNLPTNSANIMGDKSPKSVNKQKEQKQKQAGAANQKKQAAAPKSGAPAKKK